MKHLKKSFLSNETISNSVESFSDPQFPRIDQSRIYVNYSLSPGAEHLPVVHAYSPNIMLPIQKRIILLPAEHKVIDTKIRFFIPRDHYGQLKSRKSTFLLDISLFSGILCNDFSNTVKLNIKNVGDYSVTLEPGQFIADLLVSPVLHPALFPLSTIEMVVKKGLNSEACLSPELSRDLSVRRLKEAYVLLPPSSDLDLSEITEVNSNETDEHEPAFPRENQTRVWIDFCTTPGALFDPNSSFCSTRSFWTNKDPPVSNSEFFDFAEHIKK